MPHLIIEYAAALEQDTDIKTLVDAAFTAADQSGLFTPADIKVRALPFHAYTTGGTDQPFVHVEVKLLSGRSEAQKKALASSVLEHLKATLPASVAISVETNDLDRGSYSKRA